LHAITGEQANYAVARTGKRSVVAVVDDERSVLSAVSRLLRSHDFECVTYESGEVALADPKLFTVSCIVMDIQMHGIDGFELRDRIRAMGSTIPCFFITAHVLTDSAEWNRRVGGTPYLLKPFDESQLISTIDMLIGHADGRAV
jgi:FixJ family two-component response regulator